MVRFLELLTGRDYEFLESLVKEGIIEDAVGVDIHHH